MARESISIRDQWGDIGMEAFNVEDINEVIALTICARLRDAIAMFVQSFLPSENLDIFLNKT